MEMAEMLSTAIITAGTQRFRHSAVICLPLHGTQLASVALSPLSDL
jgi:hypothetical protein